MKPSFLLGFFIDTCLFDPMHPSLRIFSLFIFAIVAYHLAEGLLIWFFITAIMMLVCLDALSMYRKRPYKRFANLWEWLRLIKRMRYILLFLIIVYAFNTPGEYLPDWNSFLTPTYEGITAGVEQTLRLTLILAALAVLLVNTTREQLIAGLYYLSRPFAFLGLNPERFAVRLWLTLYYVEQKEHSERKGLLHQLRHLEELLVVEASAPEKILLVKHLMRWQDYLILLCLLLLGIYVLCASL